MLMNTWQIRYGLGRQRRIMDLCPPSEQLLEETKDRLRWRAIVYSSTNPRTIDDDDDDEEEGHGRARHLIRRKCELNVL